MKIVIFSAFLIKLNFGGTCEESGLPENAFEIASTCGLYFDGFASSGDVDGDKFFTCISYFAHETGEYGEDMYNMFNPDVVFVPGTGEDCASELLSYTLDVFGARGVEEVLCGFTPQDTSEWELVLPVGLNTKGCRHDVLQSSLAAFATANSFNIVDPLPCVGLLPENAFEIATTCALYYDGFAALEDVTVSEFQTCIAQFSTGTDEFGFAVSELFSGGISQECVEPILGYIGEVWPIKIGAIAACGAAPTGTSDWELSLPANLDSTACASLISDGLKFFYGLVSTDIRSPVQTGKCLRAASNAFEILTICALFDDANLADFSDITDDNILLCINQFDTADYALAAFEQFSNDENCAGELVEWVKNLFTLRPVSVCGDGLPESVQLWTDSDVPAELTSDDCLSVLSTSLGNFFIRNDGDIRDTDRRTVCLTLPLHSFEIATMCAIELGEYTVVSAESFAACVAANFSTEYAAEMTEMLTDEGSCQGPILDYVRGVVASGQACGSLPTGDWDAVVLSVVCGSSLRKPIDLFYLQNNGLNIRVLCGSEAPQFAYEITTSCALWGLDSVDASLQTCVDDHFDHSLRSSFGTDMFESDLCVDQLIEYAKTVFEIKLSVGDSCGDSPADGWTELEVPSEIRSTECFENLSVALSFFFETNGFDIRETATTSVCEVVHPVNAFNIVSSCALFDDTLADYSSITYENLLACALQFPYEEEEDFGFEMDVWLADPDSPCVADAITYVRNVWLRMPDPPVCGEFEAWTELGFPTEFSQFVCVSDVFGVGLEIFFHTQDADLRAGGSCTSLLPANVFEIATVCGLFDLDNLPYFISVDQDTMSNCLSLFDTISDETTDVFEGTDWITVQCILGYVRSVIGLRVDSDLCGPAPSLDDVPWSSVNWQIADLELYCMQLLSKPIADFFAANTIDIRNVLYTPCSGTEILQTEGAGSTLSHMHACILLSEVPATYLECVQADSALYTALLSPVACAPCYETLYSALIDADFGTTVCKNLDRYCFGQIFSDLENFRKCSGHLLCLWSDDICVDSDEYLDELYAFSTWMSVDESEGIYDWAKFAWLNDSLIFASSNCRVCWENFLTGLARISLRGEYACAATPWSSECVEILNEAGNPLSEFEKCAKFSMTITTRELPLCNTVDRQDIGEDFGSDSISVVPFVECVVDEVSAGEFSVEDFLGSSCFSNVLLGPSVFTDLPTNCGNCFEVLKIEIFQRLMGNQAHCDNPYDSFCVEYLSPVLARFNECVGTETELLQHVSVTLCSDADEVSTEKQYWGIQLAINSGLGETGTEYSDFYNSDYNPFYGSFPTCFVCFEGFIERLAAMPTDQKRVCTANQTAFHCSKFIYAAVEYFESCSGWTVEFVDPLVAPACSVSDWANVDRLYKSFVPLLRLSILNRPLPPSFERISKIFLSEECSACFSAYYYTNIEVSVCVVDPHSAPCLAAIADSLAAFESCAGFPLSMESPYECSSVVVSSPRTADLIANAGFGSSTEYAALLALNSTVVDTLCRPCFEGLVKNLAAIPTIQKGTCQTSPDSMECGIVLSRTAKAFANCAGFEIPGSVFTDSLR